MDVQTISAREIYHTVRRSLVSPDRVINLLNANMNSQAVRRAIIGSYMHSAEDVRDKRVRDTLREKLGVGRLPTNVASVVPQIRDVLESREASDGRPPLKARLTAYLRDKYLAEAARRGLDTSLDLAKRGSQPLHVVGEARDNGYRVMLLHASGYAEYSRRVGSYPANLSLLCGHDDAGVWAVRVPGNITDVHKALAWLKPAAVSKAEAAGKRVLRQGDVWVVERTRDGMATSELPSGHLWDAETRILWHDGHQQLHVPFPATAIRQSTLPANGIGRRRGD